MLKINGVDIPTPTDLQVGIMDISKAERNARGTMIIERVTTKRKLELGYVFMRKEDLSRLLNMVNQVFFNVEYIDPQSNQRRTGTFYVGDRTVGALDFINGNIRYKDIKLSLVER